MRETQQLNAWNAITVAALALPVAPALATEPPSEDDASGESPSRFSDDPIPLIDLDDFPKRPKPIIELGNPFLGSGTLDPGFELPTGAVWQPSLIVFGNYRTAIQTFDTGEEHFAEWANRLDLFANLQLSGTERFLVGIRPLDQDGRFSGYNFSPDERAGWREEFNARITTLFFEGDFGEIFSNLDFEDLGQLDYGFSVGRQPLFLQEGMLINDTLDAVGITRNTLFPPGGSNLRFTLLYGWDNIHRNNNDEDEGAHLFGLFSEIEYPSTTLNLDAVYILDNGDGDSVHWGASAVQRIGHFNTSFRVLGSHALNRDSPEVSDGYLLFGEVSWTPPHSHDLIYVNGFWGIDEFASAARGPDAGGPLGRTGILFAAVGLGRYGAALGNRADEAVGAALGYQMFFDHTRKQLILEVGGRTSTDRGDEGMLAIGARYQQAIGQHAVLQFDVFGGIREEGDNALGARVELEFKF